MIANKDIFLAIFPLSEQEVIELDSNKLNETDNLEYGLESLFEEYEEQIETIDFRLNTEKVRKDIMARTKTFMKKRK